MSHRVHHGRWPDAHPAPARNTVALRGPRFNPGSVGSRATATRASAYLGTQPEPRPERVVYDFEAVGAAMRRSLPPSRRWLRVGADRRP